MSSWQSIAAAHVLAFLARLQVGWFRRPEATHSSYREGNKPTGRIWSKWVQVLLMRGCQRNGLGRFTRPRNAEGPSWRIPKGLIYRAPLAALLRRKRRLL